MVIAKGVIGGCGIGAVVRGGRTRRLRMLPLRSNGAIREMEMRWEFDGSAA